MSSTTDANVNSDSRENNKLTEQEAEIVRRIESMKRYRSIIKEGADASGYNSKIHRANKANPEFMAEQHKLLFKERCHDVKYYEKETKKIKIFRQEYPGMKAKLSVVPTLRISIAKTDNPPGKNEPKWNRFFIEATNATNNLNHHNIFHYLSMNPNLMDKNILDNQKKEWCWVELTHNASLDFVRKFPRKEWNWVVLSSSPRITWKDVIDNPDEDWSYYGLSANPNINDFIVREYPRRKWDYTHMLSKNPSISLDYIFATPHKMWNYDNISLREDLMWHHVVDNPKIPWNYSYLSLNPNITMKIVLENLDKPWDFILLSKCPGITFDDILDNLQFPWSSHEMCQNPNITWDDIVASHHIIKWNYNSVIMSPGITSEAIFDNIWYWNLETISRNPNLSITDHVKLGLSLHNSWLNYRPYFHTQHYRRKMAMRNLALIKDELLARFNTFS